MAEDSTNKTEGAAPSWADGLDADHKQFLGNRGWDKLDGNAAALELAKAYRGSEKLRGGLAAGDVVALPKEGDAASAKAFWERVGTPKDATGYSFEGLTRKDGSALDGSFVDKARDAAAAVNMPAHMLQGFLGQVMPHMEETLESRFAAKQAADIEANRRQLAHEWGPEEARNKFLAARAMDNLKDVMPTEAVAALESLPGVGYVGVNKMFLALSKMMGESRFVPGSVPGAMDKDAAAARWNALSQDSAWVNRWANGGVAEREEKTNLMKIMSGAS